MPLPKLGTEDGLLYRITRSIVRSLARVLFHLSADGLEHLPRTGPAILVPNHVSWLDPIVLPLVLPRKPAFLAMEELWRMPVVGTVMRAYGPLAIPLKRGTVDTSALKRALALLQQGALLIIFPEGGISPDGSLRRFHPGAALLAARSDAPLIPVAVSGTREALPLGSLMPRPRPITIRFGPAIVVESERREDLRRALDRAAAQIRLLLEPLHRA
jgi:1-acyl-sn-glycerol-3-phosphate acyltransferase